MALRSFGARHFFARHFDTIRHAYDAATQAITGGIGHGKKKRWIERDGKILIFNTPEEAEEYILCEIKESEHSTEECKTVNTVKPIEVIYKEEIKQLSKAYNYQRKLYLADNIGDIDRVIAIYRELQRREEDDIELILIGA